MYGIDAAQTVIVKEVQDVFKVKNNILDLFLVRVFKISFILALSSEN